MSCLYGTRIDLSSAGTHTHTHTHTHFAQSWCVLEKHTTRIAFRKSRETSLSLCYENFRKSSEFHVSPPVPYCTVHAANRSETYKQLLWKSCLLPAELVPFTSLTRRLSACAWLSMLIKTLIGRQVPST